MDWFEFLLHKECGTQLGKPLTSDKLRCIPRKRKNRLGQNLQHFHLLHDHWLWARHTMDWHREWREWVCTDKDDVLPITGMSYGSLE